MGVDRPRDLNRRFQGKSFRGDQCLGSGGTPPRPADELRAGVSVWRQLMAGSARARPRRTAQRRAEMRRTAQDRAGQRRARRTAQRRAETRRAAGQPCPAADPTGPSAAEPGADPGALRDSRSAGSQAGHAPLKGTIRAGYQDRHYRDQLLWMRHREEKAAAPRLREPRIRVGFQRLWGCRCEVSSPSRRPPASALPCDGAAGRALPWASLCQPERPFSGEAGPSGRAEGRRQRGERAAPAGG